MNTELTLEGFSEISPSDQQRINGGIWPILVGIAVGIVVAAATEVIDDWDNFKNGLKGLPEEN